MNMIIDAPETKNGKEDTQYYVLEKLDLLAREFLENKEVFAAFWERLDEIEGMIQGRWDRWIQSNETMELTLKDLTQLLVAATTQIAKNAEHLPVLTETIIESRGHWGKLEVLLKSLEREWQTYNELTAKLTHCLDDWAKTPPSSSKAPSKGKESANNSLKWVLGLGIAQLLCVIGLWGWQFWKAEKPPTTLSHKEAALLEWAKSKEGQQAKNLLAWNSRLLENLNCAEEIKQLGVTLQVGHRKAEYGFCVLWVVPPSERKFKNQ